jgi:hypothetical protein
MYLIRFRIYLFIGILYYEHNASQTNKKKEEINKRIEKRNIENILFVKDKEVAF